MTTGIEAIRKGYHEIFEIIIVESMFTRVTRFPICFPLPMWMEFEELNYFRSYMIS